MSCREIHQEISLYLDGILNSSGVRRVEEHTAACPSCQKKMALMKDIPRALRTDQMLDPGPDFTAAVMQQIVIRHHLQNELKTPFRPAESREGSAEPVQTVEPTPDNLIDFQSRRAARKSPADYMLRFAAMAAALVFMMGLGVYFTGSDGVDGSARTSLNGALAWFASLVVESVQDPVLLATGVVLAAAIIVLTWWYIRRSDNVRSSR